MPLDELTLIQAVNRAMHRLLDDDERTIVFGEDVGKPGGVFGATKGLREAFGADRVFDTPISEAAILGAAIGAATHGLRPIVEIMWIDFSLVAADQLINQAANVRYLSCGALSAPMVVRTQQGHLPGSCAQHSQCLEALYASIPGLRVAVPSTSADAYTMLLAAAACDDPVLFIEHRALYARAKGPVDLSAPVPPIGGSRQVRCGSRATVVSYGAMLLTVSAALDELAADGIDCDLIDLRWLDPLDFDAVAASVATTGRLAIVHEANVTGGFGAELAARAAAECLFDLDAPVLRIGLPDVRVPAAPHLQRTVYPNQASIAADIRRLVEA